MQASKTKVGLGIIYNVSTPAPSRFCTCAWLFLNKLCQMKASLSSSSMSFSVQLLVGRACRNIIISWKSILQSLSDHFTRKAAQTYKWKAEKPWSSAWERSQWVFQSGRCRPQLTRYVSHILIVFLTLISRMRRQFIHRKLN